ncbi:hypothetical protein L2E82_49510 [Cichorium intybus]|uniref:Uncharacterized protein n=1 Tax=Cichorium intybus TaxID=13427 RepID=A0ACB8Z0R5_CICIN|nr:hypothetical protein L2E82_49510 [Cichorium intybus]
MDPFSGATLASVCLPPLFFRSPSITHKFPASTDGTLFLRLISGLRLAIFIWGYCNFLFARATVSKYLVDFVDC